MKKEKFNTIKIIIVPFLMLIVGFFLSIYFYLEVSPLTLQYVHPTSQISFPLSKELLKGDRIHGEFIAKENNLGTIAIPITTFNRLNNDIIVFEMRVKGAKFWNIVNKYVTDRFPNDKPYPFGFPVINNSQGKTYEFEVYSMNGVRDNAVGFTKGSKFFYSRYTFSRTYLTGEKSLASFAQKKVANLLMSPQYIFYLLLFLAPTFLYYNVILDNKIEKKHSKIRGIIPYTFIASFLIVYIIQPVSMKSDIVWYIVVLIYLTASYFHKHASDLLVIGLILLIVSPLWLLMNIVEIANRSAIMIWFITGISLILLYKESLHDSNKSV